MNIFDGRKFAREKEKRLVFRGVVPKLVSILVGNDPASRMYVNLKRKAGERVGAKVEILKLSADTGVEEIIETVQRLNKDTSVHGIMVQMPLPGALAPETEKIINAITPSKDVDGLKVDSPYFHPTAKAVVDILEFALPDLEKRKSDLKIVVVGSRGMVGRPLIRHLTQRGFNVIPCNTQTKDLAAEVAKGDVVVSATGATALIKANMIKPGAVVIDVGAPMGDVEFEKAAPLASFITPVPGGVGPVTISCLLENVINSAKMSCPDDNS